MRTPGGEELSNTSYLPGPANPFPDTEVDEDPGDGQCYCQRHSKLAWFFQAIGHFMHVAPESQSDNKAVVHMSISRRDMFRL